MQRWTLLNPPRAGEKLEVVKKQLKVQKKEKKQAVSPAKPKKKLKGIRIRKGTRVKVPLSYAKNHE